MTIGLNQPATVVVNRKQGSRLELEPSVVKQANGDYRGDVHFDNDYLATATCANGATEDRPFHVGPANTCGACANVPTKPGPAPMPTVAPPSNPAQPVDTCDPSSVTVAWVDPATAAGMDRETATVTPPRGCTTAGFYYVAWGYTVEGEPHRIAVEAFEAGGVHLAGAWADIYPRWMVELRDGHGVVLSMVEGVTR